MTELPTDIQRLLAGERSIGPGVVDALSIKARIAASVAAIAVPSTAAAGTGKVLSLKLVALIIGVGAVTGTAVFIETRSPDAPAPAIAIPSIERSEPVATPVAESPVVVAPEPRAPTKTTRTAPVKSVSAATSAVGSDEADLIVAATRALKRGDADLALASLDAHATRFPHGALAEERDAIHIEALLAAHRNAEAHRVAEAFAATYPHSVHQPLIERAMKETPQ